MAHSVELRVPLVDVDLIRSVARLVPNKFPPAKAMLAQISNHRLPEAIITRPKTGFEIPVGVWVKRRPSQRSHGIRNWANHVHDFFAKGQLAPA